MIERYSNPGIATIWTDAHKLQLWLKVELAVLEAKANLGLIPRRMFRQIAKILLGVPINVRWWEKRDKQIHHDLQAFVDERWRHLPPELRRQFHAGMTSYDTEEAAFASMLCESLGVVTPFCRQLEEILIALALKYRHTPMLGETHGQWAELQTFGKRCLTWLRDLRTSQQNLERAAENLRYSRLCGAVGNYAGGLSPRVEKEALRLLGFEPYYGVTQIMPRELYAPLAQALAQLVLTLHKIALAIRLGARSGCPIYQEPFGKIQAGSSAMPHKKNPIRTEQIEGMARMALGYSTTIQLNISTWAERAIEQSCVERVAWPDLFHVVAQSFKTMIHVLGKLRVYPDNMLQQILESRGCYAAVEAKEFLRGHGLRVGLSSDAIYRLVQLAAFRAFSVDHRRMSIREEPPSSFDDAETVLGCMAKLPDGSRVSLQEIIANGQLVVHPELAITERQVQRWNVALQRLFANTRLRRE